MTNEKLKNTLVGAFIANTALMIYIVKNIGEENVGKIITDNTLSALLCLSEEAVDAYLKAIKGSGDSAVKALTCSYQDALDDGQTLAAQQFTKIINAIENLDIEEMLK